jgi:hypothetical protein
MISARSQGSLMGCHSSSGLPTECRLNWNNRYGYVGRCNLSFFRKWRLIPPKLVMTKNEQVIVLIEVAAARAPALRTRITR